MWVGSDKGGAGGGGDVCGGGFMCREGYGGMVGRGLS